MDASKWTASNGHVTDLQLSGLKPGLAESEHGTDLQLSGGFNVSIAPFFGISDIMNSTFSDASNPSVWPNHCDKDTTNHTFLDDPSGHNFVLGRPGDETANSSTALEVLYHSQDLNATFATLAQSMTSCIRANSDDNLVMTGKTGTLHVMYQVRWEFLILPFILVFVNTVFFVIVIYHTHKLGLAILCSDANSIVGFGGSIGPIFSKIKLRSQMEKAAKLEQIGLISNPREDSSSSDVEDVTSREGNDVTTLHESEGHESEGRESEGHEMLPVGERIVSQDSVRRRSDEIRSTGSFISRDEIRSIGSFVSRESRGAPSPI